MRYLALLCLLIGALALPGLALEEQVCLNGEWQFAPQYEGEGLQLPGPKDFDQAPIRVPCPWNVNSFSRGDGGDFECYPSYPAKWEQARIGWYQRQFTVPKDWQGDRVLLRFEAVHYYCEVYVNGQKAGAHEGGFTPFELDVTSLVTPGQPATVLVGVMEMRFFNEQGRAPYPWGSFWGEHARGIWQDVWLLRRPQVAVEDVYLITSTRKGTIELRPTVNNNTKAAFTGQLRYTVRDWPGGEVIHQWTAPAQLSPGLQQLPALSEVWPDAQWWSPEDPHLYLLTAELLQNGQVLSRKEDRFGFREVWLAEGDFFLNGVRRKFLGDAWHYMGVAEQSPEYARLWYEVAKKQGVNYIRLHAMVYPPFFLDVADEVGMLICDESSIWASACNFLYNDAFFERCRQHLEEFVKRDRNHPCVVDWSVENEVLAAHGVSGTADGAPTYDWLAAKFAELADWMRQFDATRPISADGDGDLYGRMETYSYHYPGPGDPGIEGKPTLIGESSSLFYTWPSEEWHLGGDKVYESVNGHLSAIAEEYGYTLQQYRRWADLVTPFNLVWYGLRPLPLAGKPITYDRLDTPGMKPERIGPYSITLNAGYDPALPKWELNPFGECIGDNFHHQQVFVEERDTRFYSGEEVERTLRVQNDVPRTADLTLSWRLMQGKERLAGEDLTLRLEPAEQRELKVSLPMPSLPARTPLSFELTLLEAGQPVYEKSFRYDVFPRFAQFAATLAGKSFDVLASSDSVLELPVLQALQSAGVKLNRVGSPWQSRQVLIVPPGQGGRGNEDLARWLNEGGRALILEGNLLSLPEFAPGAGLELQSNLGLGAAGPSTAGAEVRAFPAQGTPPVLRSLFPDDLKFWRGPKDQNVCREGWARVVPGARPLAVYNQGNPCLLEIPRKDGLALASSLLLAEKALSEPVACLLLVESLRYLEDAPGPHWQKTAVLTGSDDFWLRLRTLGVIADRQSKPTTASLGDYTCALVQAGELGSSAAPLQGLAAWVKAGGQLLVLGTSPAEQLALAQLTGGKVEVTPHQWFEALVGEQDPLTSGLSGDDLFWLEKSGERKLVANGIILEGAKPLIVTNPLDWRRRCLRGENIKTSAIARAEVELRPRLPVLAALQMGKGRLVLDQISLAPDYDKSRKVFLTLLSNLGVLVNPTPNLTDAELAALSVDESGYVRSWLVCGPFDGGVETLSTELLEREPYVYPVEGSVSKGLLWAKVRSDAPVLNLKQVFGEHTNSTAFACFYVECPPALAGKPFTLSLGSDDGILARVNGKTVWANPVTRPAIPDQERVPGVEFKPGWNRVMLKIANGSGEWGFCARVLDGEGKPAKGLRVVAQRPTEGLRELEPTDWTATAWMPTGVEAAFDRNPLTRWATGIGMEPGMWYQLDLGAAHTLARLVLDTAGSPSDYTRGLKVETSLDGQEWTELLTLAEGQAGPVTTVSFDPVTARFIKLTQLGRNGGFYWSIHELRLFTLPGPTDAA